MYVPIHLFPFPLYFRVPEPAEMEETDDGAEAEALLKYHRKLQWELSEDLVQLTQNLKHNVTVMGEIMRKDDRVIEETEQVMVLDLEKLKKERGRLGVLIQSVRSGTCTTWLVLLLVCILFFVTFIFIRLFPVRR